MKLLTLNTHSLMEEDYEKKCLIFAEEIVKIKPDIIALQEVNQGINSPPCPSPKMLGFIKGDNFIPIKADNHAIKIAKLLKERGENYFFTWTGIKCGYEKFDEGLAIFSKIPFDKIKSFYISRGTDYHNFRTRKALSVKIGNKIFCSVHTGWMGDTEEPFSYQLESLNRHLSPKRDENIFLMGDFNSPACEENGGYSEILKSGWLDTYSLAKEKDEGATVFGKIDGWSDNTNKKRIDYIFSNHHIKVFSSKVIFDGKETEKVSDHCGVLISIEGELYQ
ncbi:MAG: endonuclease/exonuclease/phosphatase family protein [Clostridia bacterium]|nr:endonuclease/exonuclease/phosphatase family protein [Clostridia bacterium]